MALVGQVQTLVKEDKLDEARALAFGKTYDALHALAANPAQAGGIPEQALRRAGGRGRTTYTTALRIIAIVAAVRHAAGDRRRPA